MINNIKKLFDLEKIKFYIKNNCRSDEKVLGIDFGTRKIGIAFGLINESIVIPMPQYIRKISIESDLNYFHELIVRSQIKIIIIGASLLDEGQYTLGNKKLFKLSKDFMSMLNKKLKNNAREVIYAFYNEDFTSTFANNCLHSYGVSNSSKNKSEDSLAATLMLEEALDEIMSSF